MYDGSFCLIHPPPLLSDGRRGTGARHPVLRAVSRCLTSGLQDFAGRVLFALVTTAAVTVLLGVASASAHVGPPAPDQLTLEPGDQSISVSWTAAVSAVRYELQYRLNEDPPNWVREADNIPPDSRSYEITGLTNDIEYWVRVRAWDDDSHGGVWHRGIATPTDSPPTSSPPTSSPPASSPPATPTDTAPSFGDAEIDDQTFTVDEQIMDLQLPPASGGDPPREYSLEEVAGGDLPDGLYFDESAQVLSGTPTELQVETAYVYGVRDADGDMDEIEFTIEIVAEAAAEDGDGGGCTMIGGTENAVGSSVFSLFLILTAMFSAILCGRERRRKDVPRESVSF